MSFSDNNIHINSNYQETQPLISSSNNSDSTSIHGIHPRDHNIFVQEYIVIGETVENINSFWKDFKGWLGKSTAVDLGLGVIIGTMFSSILDSFMKDILVPPLGLLFGSTLTNLFLVLAEGDKGGPYPTLEDAASDGAITLNYGQFTLHFLKFMVVVLTLYILIRLFHTVKRELEEAHNEKTRISQSGESHCPACDSVVSPKAIRCPFCTSFIKGINNGSTNENQKP